MTEYFNEQDVVAVVHRLTPEKLTRFVEARFVVPAQGSSGKVFRRIDVARLELLCELSDEFEMPDDSVDLVMSLVDQLHGVRGELQAVMQALESESGEVRSRVVETLYLARASGNRR